jgi:hypothetical protein
LACALCWSADTVCAYNSKVIFGVVCRN